MIDYKPVSEEEIKTISLDEKIQEPATSLSFDYEQFAELDKKIKAGNATNDEESSFGTLVPKMAKIQVKDYEHLSPEDEK